MEVSSAPVIAIAVGSAGNGLAANGWATINTPSQPKAMAAKMRLPVISPKIPQARAVVKVGYRY